MVDDPYSLLGIPSAEAEAVAEILRPRQPAQRQVYGSPYEQSYADYSQTAEENMNQRDDLAIQAEIQRRMTLPTVSGIKARKMAWEKSLKDAIYEKQASALIADLQKIDPADPDALSFQDEVIGKHPIAKQALSDPRIANLVKRQSHDNAEMAELFDKDPASRQEYADLRANNVPPSAARQQVKSSAQKRADRIWFATAGGDPAEFDSGKFNGPDGRPDRAKMAFHLNKIKKGEDSLLGSTERKALDKAAEDFQAMATQNPDDETAKRAAFQMQFGRDPDSDADWASAYRLVQNAGQSQKEALAALILDFERAGRQVPDFYKKMIGVPAATTEASVENVPRGTSEAPAQPSASKPVLVRNRAEFDALPPGTRVMDAKGNVGVKK